MFLIYGSNGWIGSQFIDILKLKNIKYHIGSSRVDDIKELLHEIDTIKPLNIISLIGRTHGKINNKIYPTIDYLEQPNKLTENIRDNLFSPILLAKICHDKNIHFTYLGTGCIFNSLYDKQKFNEDDLPNFTGSSYSTVKGYTDRLMHLYPNVLNLRIRMPITGYDHPRNFITKIKTYNKVCSISNSMSVLPDILPIAINLIKKNYTGTVNLTNPGTISHNEILNLYKQHVDPSFTWENFPIEEQDKVLESKRSNNCLDTTLLEKLDPSILDIKSSINKLLLDYKKDDKFQRIKSHDFPDTKDTILFITGGAGFIGSNFINYLFDITFNITIINFDALYYAGNINYIKENIRNNIRYKFIHGNLQSIDLLNYIFKTNKITHIIHFAAQSHVTTSFDNSIQYTLDNVVGTHNLLESVKNNCKYLKKFIHVSTDEVYGESLLHINETQKIESSNLFPSNPYSATKAAAECICQSYIQSFKLPIVITRGNNVYGTNQHPEKVIPKFIKQLKNNKKITIEGDGSCVRSFLNVTDACTAFKLILDKGQLGEIYNIGCEKDMEYSIIDIAKILIKKIKNTEDYREYIEFIKDRPFNDKRYYISNDKLKALGWNINILLNDGLNNMIK